jgi:hypothetical protein
MGSRTMSDIRREFMEMREKLFPNQRPFKFHMYDIEHFVRPDRNWEDGVKARFRKCKHILVSLDEMEELSQMEYRSQVTVFIGHLLRLMDDETFPIWMFTVNAPQMAPRNCHSPTLPRTTDHPCNDVLKDLFRDDAENFPNRVHLLDNTDISNPSFGENVPSVLATIAMRVYVFVGKGVADWRAVGQHGLIDGLHRNGTVEPNFELVPYEGW